MCSPLEDFESQVREAVKPMVVGQEDTAFRYAGSREMDRVRSLEAVVGPNLGRAVDDRGRSVFGSPPVLHRIADSIDALLFRGRDTRKRSVSFRVENCQSFQATIAEVRVFTCVEDAHVDVLANQVAKPFCTAASRNRRAAG